MVVSDLQCGCFVPVKKKMLICTFFSSPVRVRKVFVPLKFLLLTPDLLLLLPNLESFWKMVPFTVQECD